MTATLACSPTQTSRAPAPDLESQTRVAVEGTRLFLLGRFDSGTPAVVHAALSAHPNVQTLVFTANGGSVDDRATLELGREIRARGLHTSVIGDGAIASGGVDLFLSGTHRSVERGARIGVHSWEHCWGDADGEEPGCKQAKDHDPADPEHALHLHYVEEMLHDDAFYWFSIAAAPSDSIHWMTDEEIERFGLATDGLDDTRSAQPFGAALAQERARVAPR